MGSNIYDTASNVGCVCILSTVPVSGKARHHAYTSKVKRSIALTSKPQFAYNPPCRQAGASDSMLHVLYNLTLRASPPQASIERGPLQSERRPSQTNGRYAPSSACTRTHTGNHRTTLLHAQCMACPRLCYNTNRHTCAKPCVRRKRNHTLCSRMRHYANAINPEQRYKHTHTHTAERRIWPPGHERTPLRVASGRP